MQVRLSGAGQDAFRFLPAASLHIRGIALWSGDELAPIGAGEGAAWTWNGARYVRIDLMGPLAIEFRDRSAGYPRAELGLFDRLYLVDRSLCHRDLVVARYESALAQWLCTCMGRFYQEVRIRGAAKDILIARRKAMIQQAAYFNAERRGFSTGQENEDWLRAEEQIDAQLWYSLRMRSLGAPLLRV
jgi:hypothetical protein